MKKQKWNTGSGKLNLVVIVCALTACAALAAGVYFVTGKDAAPEKPAARADAPPATAPAEPSGSGRTPAAPVIPEDVPGLIMTAGFDVPLLVDAIDANVPAEKKDARYMANLILIRGLNLRRAEVFLFRDPQFVLLPALVLKGDESADFEKLLDTVGADYVRKESDGVYVFRTEAIPEAEENRLPLKDYRVWTFPGHVVAGPVRLARHWADGAGALTASALTDFAAGAAFPGALLTFASRIAEPDADWKDRIRNHPALKENPDAGMMVNMGGGVLSDLMASFKDIDALAMAAGLSGERGRKVAYVQHFKDPDAGAAVHRKMTEDGSWEGGGFMGHFMGLLRRAGYIEKDIRYDDGSLTVDLSWDGKDDASVKALVTQATIGFIFSRSLGLGAGGFDPSPGYVVTRTTDPPELAETLDPIAMQPVIEKTIRNSIFPGMYWDFGDSPRMDLKLDPIDFPNAALSELEYRVASAASPDGADILGDANEDYARIFGGSIAVPVKQGLPAEKLGHAVLDIRLAVPSAVAVFDFTPADLDGPEKSADGLTASLDRLEKDVAAVSVSNGERCRVFAFDEHGNALTSGESMSSDVSATVRFNGVIRSVRAAVVKSSEILKFQVKADLNQGKEPALPESPVADPPVRHVRLNRTVYPNLSPDDLMDLTVRWVEDEEGVWFNGLGMALPRGPVEGKADWQVNFFGADRPVMLSGNAGSAPMNLQYNVDKEQLKTAHAAFGRAEVVIRTDIVSLEFTKTGDGVSVTRRLPNGAAAAVVFDRNSVVTADMPPGVELIQHAALSAEGRPLRMGRRGYGGGKPQFLYFGTPVTFTADVSMGVLRKTVSFDIVRRPADEAAYTEYKAYARVIPDVKAVLNDLQKARYAARQNRRSDIAQLHYAFGKDGRPLTLISKEIAHSDPAGADVFGYAPTPHLGYFFTVAEGTASGGENAPYPQSDPVSVTWKNGVVSVTEYRNDPALMALPQKDGMPAFCLVWGQMYTKAWHKDDKPFVPADFFDSDWASG